MPYWKSLCATAFGTVADEGLPTMTGEFAFDVLASELRLQSSFENSLAMCSSKQSLGNSSQQSHDRWGATAASQQGWATALDSSLRRKTAF
jgi:hypothetical protein